MNYLAVDIGAESGRVMWGNLADGVLRLEELHRFANQPVALPAGLYWDSFRLFHEIVEGLTVAGRERKLRVDGIGIDTWGVDFGLLGGDGGLIDCPRHYRDARNKGAMERLFGVIPRHEVFERTGIQFMQINSLCQFASCTRRASKIRARSNTPSGCCSCPISLTIGLRASRARR
jgi:rhamnulokinase